MRAEATVDGEVVAAAQVTKSVVRLRRPAAVDPPDG
jgi:hypothetical protein